MNVRIPSILCALAAIAAGCSEQPSAPPTPAVIQGAPLDAPVAAKEARADAGSLVMNAAPEDSAGAGAPPPRPAYDPSKQYSTEDVDLSKAPVNEGEFKKLTFAKLAGFEYWPYPADTNDPNASLPSEIPAEIKALDGAKVVVGGYMVPIEIRSGKVRSFLLVRNQLACCFGMPSSPNEWIDVRMAADKVTKYIADVPIAVKGTLEVGEKKTQDGVVLSIYRMEATDIHAIGGY